MDIIQIVKEISLNTTRFDTGAAFDASGSTVNLHIPILLLF